ncbi:MAG: glycosyltransferase, partial [Gemmataceae bacterium]|nr:glycosyltransferase [Gemmataceae bacterium]
PKHVIGAAGRLSPEKGFDVLADAASLLCQRRGEVGFLVFGRGPLEDDVRNRIARAGLEDRFVLGGFRTDVERLLPGFDLFASPSRTEGLPVAVLEAQAAAVPVVATAVGGTPEALADGRTGLLVPTERPDLLAASLESLLDDDGKRRAMGDAARKRVKEEFGFAAQAAAYERLLGRLARPRKGAAHGHR